MSIGLLVALSTLAPSEREAWIEWNMRGQRAWSKQALSEANRKLRDYFGTAEGLRDAA